MCGIFALFGDCRHLIDFEKIDTLRGRGPDSDVGLGNDIFYFHFYRLKINDLSDIGNQPFTTNGVYLMCNGEIYNHHEANLKHNLTCFSKSDCETILHLYLKLREDNTLTYQEMVCSLARELDGEFAFVLYDTVLNRVVVCRDRYGVRPLFKHVSENRMCFSSELKSMCPTTDDLTLTKQVEPGCVEVYQLHFTTTSNVIDSITYNKYVYRNPLTVCVEDPTYTEEKCLETLRVLFTDAVHKRLMSDRPIASLLSGGLDSSLVASIVAKHYNSMHQKLKTFSIGFENSTDLQCARLVAEHIGSDHTEVCVTPDDFLNEIENTIRTIESYDITSVRASVGNRLVAKYISEHSDCKTIYTGEYSDEVQGGYAYFKNAPDDMSFYEECVRLVNDITYYDSLRSDRSVSGFGLDSRVPFSDYKFIEYYLSLPIDKQRNVGKIEKYLLRTAFSGTGLLPENILFRPKEAFSDGVSGTQKSWFQIIQEHVDTLITDEEFNENKDKYTHNTPFTKEAYYYRKIFDKYYHGYDHIIPYFWMPKWNNGVNDPSARVLKSYVDTVVQEQN